MYLNTTDKVKKLYDRFEQLEIKDRIKFTIYILDKLNNNLINERNEVNPHATDEDFEIFNFETFGMNVNDGLEMIYYLIEMLKDYVDENIVYSNHLIIINYDDIKKLLSNFEKLSFKEKIDVVEELLIRYDNNILLNDRELIIKLPDVIYNIEFYKKKLNNNITFPYEVID